MSVETAYSLTRALAGQDVRIEIQVFSLQSVSDSWVVLCAAGLDQQQPSNIRVLGPFAEEPVALEQAELVARGLHDMDYTQALHPDIWQLHMRSRLRQLQTALEYR